MDEKDLPKKKLKSWDEMERKYCPDCEGEMEHSHFEADGVELFHCIKCGMLCDFEKESD